MAYYTVDKNLLDESLFPGSIKLPEYSDEDEGKVLKIVNGVPILVSE